MLEEIRNIKSGKSDLRKFGITMGIASGILGGILHWLGKEHALIFLSLAALFLFLGLVLPHLLKPAQKTWMTVAVLMGWVMTRVILSVLFYLLLTPTGLLAKLFGKRFLDTRFPGKSAQSYWIKKEKLSIKKEDYERQF